MTESDDDGEYIMKGIRCAKIIASTVYPLVSAFEFEFLKKEEILQKRWDNCTIYMVVQRPLTYFDNVVIDDGYIHFDIADGNNPPLSCRINLVANGLCEDGEEVEIRVEFYSNTPGKEQPLRNVGAFRIFRPDGRFVVWWSPQKILYEALVNGLAVEMEEDGNPFAFLDFKVHYIGKSFSQQVWERLTGHEKMQSILVREREIGTSPDARAPFEISLIFLNLIGLDDVPMLGGFEAMLESDAKPILHSIDLSVDGALETFMCNPPVKLGDEALTREVEALLISEFRPQYNEVLFSNYPEIKGGMRSKGYTDTNLTIERLPVYLYTDHFRMGPMEDREPVFDQDGEEGPNGAPSLVDALFNPPSDQPSSPADLPDRNGGT